MPRHHKDAINTATLFVHGETWLHGLHPFNKLSYILLTAAAVYCGPGEWITGIVFIFGNLAAARSAQVLGPAWRLVWRTLLPIGVFMIGIHGFLYPGNRTLLFSFGLLHVYMEGVAYSLEVLLQLTALLTASLLFVLSTHPVDLVTALLKAGLPHSLAYVVGSPLLLLPILRERIGTIRAAQRSRGLDSEGNVRQRFFALFPLLAPLVLRSLVEVEQRSIALEIRGFNAPGQKTSFRILPDTICQRFSRRALLIISCVIIAHRLWR